MRDYNIFIVDFVFYKDIFVFFLKLAWERFKYMFLMYILEKMVKKSILFFVFTLFVISGIYFVSVAAPCNQLKANYSGCAARSDCFWQNNSGTLQYPSCDVNSTNFNLTDTIMCIPYFNSTYPGGCSIFRFNYTNNNISNAGCCEMKSGSGGGGSGLRDCYSFDRNETGCTNSYNLTGAACSWKANNQNQNSWCSNNVGCCVRQSCMDYGGTQNSTNNCSIVLGGVCSFKNITQNTYCPNPNGCCEPKSCGEQITQPKCDQLSQLGMSCYWNSTDCLVRPCNMNNDSQSCLNSGMCFWNSTGSSCVSNTGSGGGGGGGFMFASEAKCWFADNQRNSCLNVTGCVYCSSAAAQINNASSACYNAAVGNCKGHESRTTNLNLSSNLTVNIIDINTSSMTCSNILSKQICNCGPLPNCKWSNTTDGADYGNYCTLGTLTMSEKATLCSPPGGVTYCEHPNAKNNETLCNLLASNYMMPCKWDNVSTPNRNCTFNSNAAFGSSSGGTGGSSSNDFNRISNSVSCIAGGGNWRTENYLDSDLSFKSDSWCEKKAMFDFSSGGGNSGTGNCDSDCWACNFNSTGGAWGGNVTWARNNCTGSRKGVCVFKEDSNAPNRLGWCDYPKEMNFGGEGSKDCATDCKTCELIGNTSQSVSACQASAAGCNWVNDTSATNGKGGYCISSSKGSCSSNCFNCFDQNSCSNSSFHTSLNCSWDSNSKFCKPQGFVGEICFNGVDDDNDNKMDCGDNDCSYDNFCGGGSIGSGSISSDCKRKITQGICNQTISPNGKNCTWISPSFGGQAYCDYPGSDCWMFDNNITACNVNKSCIYRNTTGGYPMGSDGVSIPSKAFSGFCDINMTRANICYNASNKFSSVNCSLASECVWINDTYNSNGGRCEFSPFALCGSAMNSSDCNGGNVSGVNRSTICAWTTSSYSNTGGFCGPKCMSLAIGSCTGFCANKTNICEPEMFGGMESGGMGAGGIGGGFGCHMYDGNQTSCIQQNVSCSWNAFSQNASQGICQPKGEQAMMSGMDMGAPPKVLGSDTNDTNPSEIDIAEYGIKDSSSAFGFGIIVRNITNASVCKGYYVGGMGGGFGSQPVLGIGNSTTKFYLFLDTNKNLSGGCNATTAPGTNITGFEFLIKYVVSLSNQTVLEQKSFMRCVSGEWVLTNVPLTSNRQMMCGMSIPSFGGGFSKLGGVMILVDKEQLKSFSEYNSTVSMRVFASSANSSGNELSPSDSVNPGYYTPGSADFKFVDCSNPDTKDAKCKNFQQFGFNIFEDCKNGKDDDGDGLVDCADGKCKFTPVCSGGAGTAFNFTADANDNTAPTISFSQVDVLPDAAFIKFDSDEPANGTVDFYYNDSTCGLLNNTFNDTGDPLITYDNFKPFHKVDLDINSLGYNLVNGTVYYYKTGVCDPSSNCATSSCLNFTTSNDGYKNFIFKMSLPTGYTVNITGSGINYNGNFTTNIGGTIYPIGVKTNASVSRNINITVNCGTQSLTFVGADILKPKSIDMTNAFVCNTTANTLGMNSTSKSWNQLVGDIGMGGQSDYIKLTYPITYNSSNVIKWCDDELTNCTTVTDYANCASGGSGKTNCKIPTSLGFSAYQITVASAGTTTTTSPGGSTGGVLGSITMTYIVNNNDFKNGYTKQILKGDKFKLNVSGSNHYVALDKISSSGVSINVTSTLQQATINIGNEEKFDVTEDGYYDISVKVNSVDTSGNISKASLTVKSINEKISATAPVTGNVVSNGTAASNVDNSAGFKAESKMFWILILAVIIIIVVVIVIVIFFRKGKSSNNKYVVYKRG